MSLLYPIGLLALAGLIIPVLLHLWNIKQGKTLKIGSIALLGENASSSARSFKITDWLLFVLRCLLLILIAFVLAQPLLKKEVKATKNSGWILVDIGQFPEVYQSQKKSIDSLLNLGFELHDFNLGFKSFLLKDSKEKVEQVKKLSYTSLLNQLNVSIPAGYSAYLFADHRLHNFEGKLPKLNFNLVWRTLNSTDTVKTWSTKFLDKNYEGKSTPSLTSYSANSTQNLPIIKVAIYDPVGADAKYIKAGLSAIQDFTKRKIHISNWNASNPDADVVFWFSEQPFDSKLKADATLFTYQKGKVMQVNSILNLGSESNQEIELKQRINKDEIKGVSIWSDGFGEPILVKRQESQVNHYYFYSRFNPQWTDLVWNEQFVKALLPIVLGNQSTADFGFENNPADQRALAKQQLVDNKINQSSTTSIVTTQNLERLFWILALVVLIIERILSFRKKLDHVKN